MKSDGLRGAGDPHWVDVLPAGEFLGLPEKTVLHSGPPIEFARMCPLHRRGMINACFMEGWAKTEAEAVKLLESGEVKCEAAYDYATVGSGTGIITASVPLLIVEDRLTGKRAGVFPHEGKYGGGFCGWGVYSDAIAANLAYMRDTLFPPLVEVLKDAGGFPMRDLFAEAIRMGDELHSCQKAIDCLFTRAIVPYALKCPNAAELLTYFATTPRFTHNFGQAASRATLLGVTARGTMVAAGGNGVEYGIKVAGSDKWYTAPSPMIVGPYLTPGAKKENQLPWIGDSSVTECRGWGGRIRAVNPEFESAGRGVLPTQGSWQDEASCPRRESGAGRQDEASCPRKGAAGQICGQDALVLPIQGQKGSPSAANAAGQICGQDALVLPPVINGGMIDVNGGWMGAGSTRIPEGCFTKAKEDGYDVQLA